MRQSSGHYSLVLLLAVAASLFVVAGLVGGPHFARDVAAIHSLTMERARHPELTQRAILLTEIGGAPGMMIILAIALASLAVVRRWRDLAVLAGIILGGRVTIESLKLAIDRPRPTLTPYPVEVASLSFPSGHAGNSMITFLAIALLAVPRQWRRVAVAAGIALSLAIGATRPLLGVHWPTDIIGGWSFGIFWVVTLAALTRNWRGAAE